MTNNHHHRYYQYYCDCHFYHYYHSLQRIWLYDWRGRGHHKDSTASGDSTFPRVIGSLKMGEPIHVQEEEPRRASSLSPVCPRGQYAPGPLPGAQTVPCFNRVQVQGAALGSRPVRGSVRDSSPLRSLGEGTQA